MREEWIPAFGQMTYGIYVLTTQHENQINGMIASWVTQVSYRPPLVLVAIHPNRYSHQLIEQSGAFALHAIGKDQKDYLARFKGPDAAGKFDSMNWKGGKTGSPILEDCIAWLDCRVQESLAPGNHTLFIGQVVDAALVTEREVLCTADYEGIYLGKS